MLAGHKTYLAAAVMGLVGLVLLLSPTPKATLADPNALGQLIQGGFAVVVFCLAGAVAALRHGQKRAIEEPLRAVREELAGVRRTLQIREGR